MRENSVTRLDGLIKLVIEMPIKLRLVMRQREPLMPVLIMTIALKETIPGELVKEKLTLLVITLRMELAKEQLKPMPIEQGVAKMLQDEDGTVHEEQAGILMPKSQKSLGVSEETEVGNYKEIVLD